MPDEVAEQTALAIPGAEEATVEAPAGAVEPVVEPAAGGEEAVAEAPVTFDLSTDAGILAALEANPNLKGFLTKREADAANTARQRRDAELRRDQGANERAQQYHQWLVSELENGSDPKELARQTPTWVKANEDFNRSELMRALLTQAGELDETAKGLAETLEGTPDELTKVAQVALDSAIKRARSDAVAGLSMETLPEALKAQVDSLIAAQVEAKLAAELAASRLEQQLAGQTNPPNVIGTAPDGRITPYWQMTTEQRLALTPQERDAAVAASLGAA